MPTINRITPKSDIDAGDLRVDGPRENGTGGDEKDAETDAHVTPFAGCRPIRSGAGEYPWAMPQKPPLAGSGD